MGSPDDAVPEDADGWVRRPFARTFDLILSEYAGYTDESLLQVTLSRLHQMRAVIMERKREDRMQQLILEETKLRVLASSIHGAAGSKKGAKAAAKSSVCCLTWMRLSGRWR